MSAKTRIGILGAGGVGGYFGGFLAAKYFNDEAIEIIFIVRPATEKIIKEKGITLITPQYEKIIPVEKAVSDPKNIGALDFLVCCIKSYDLEASLIPLKNSITPNTVILPLLNGIDARDRIQKIYPDADVWEGCVYIISKLLRPGVIQETGNIHTIYFGSSTADPTKLKQLEKIFKDANIDAFASDNIEATIWEKFVFISGVASLTSYLNIPTGQILHTEKHKHTLIKLMDELISIADAKKIRLPENIIEKALERIEKLPPETTSSMQRDFEKGGKTEYASLTGYVVILGDKLNIDTPEFDKILSAFTLREKK